MRHTFIKTGAIALLLFIFSQAYSQDSDVLEIQRGPNGKVAFARLKSGNDQGRSINNGTSFLRNILQMRSADSLANFKTDTDELGFMHKRFQQYYKGVKVENATYAIHGKGNNIETINGEFADVKLSSVKALLTEPQALVKALQHVDARKYK